MVEEARGEANFSAEQPASRQAARLSAPHVDPSRPTDPEGSPPEGSAPPVGLIWRIRGRATFEALHREGRRARHGPVTVTFLNDDATHSSPPRVAFAVSRRAGGAVIRNRIRRRLRAVLAELAGAGPTALPAGAYLVGASAAAAELPYPQLRDHVRQAVRQASAQRGRS